MQLFVIFQVRVRNYPRSSFDRISRELEREVRDNERARIEKERINLREKMVIKEVDEDTAEENENGTAEDRQALAEARLCKYRFTDFLGLAEEDLGIKLSI
jgi:hypothetical protein